METAAFVKQLFEQTSFLNSPEGLYEPIEYTMRLSGKRLRPQLLINAAQMFGGNPNDVTPAAIAIETFHNFTLLHDDLMDRAPLRRGQPTVHQKWNANVAILSGDAMLVLAWKHLLRLHCDKLHDVLTTFNNTAIGVMEGQQYDMEFEFRSDVSIPEYIEMIRLKTAVLLAGALKIGALCANAPTKDINRLYNFGIHLGIAFQLQDDLLDAYGNTATLGKKTGQDILDNKKTYLPLKALEIATTEQADVLRQLFSTNCSLSNSEKIEQVKNIYNQLNIQKYTQEEIDKQFDTAKYELKNIELPNENKEVLQQLAQGLIGRQK